MTWGLSTMAYDDFTLDRVLGDFSLKLDVRTDLFGRVPEVVVRPSLRSYLDDGVPLAVDVNTDKMRGELITAPIVAEVWLMARRRISFFSGSEFDVSEVHGLTGNCGFILALSRLQLILSDPAVIIYEARNEDIGAGLGPCGAQMVAARMFNERDGHGPTTIYGAVTTGIHWRFLKLESNQLFVDSRDYYLDPVGKILGILWRCVGGDPAGPSAEARDRERGSGGGTIGLPR